MGPRVTETGGLSRAREMVKITVYFGYAENRSSSKAAMGGPLAVEIADIKRRVESFGNELAFRIPDGETLTVAFKSIGDQVAAYEFSSSLGIDVLKNEIEKTAKGLNLTPTHLRPGRRRKNAVQYRTIPTIRWTSCLQQNERNACKTVRRKTTTAELSVIARRASNQNSQRN